MSRTSRGSSSRPSGASLLRDTSIFLAAALVLALAGFALVRAIPEPPEPYTGPTTFAAETPPAPPVAVFLGDSYTQGVGAERPSVGFACAAARRLGWLCKLEGQSGTGYVNDGQSYKGAQPEFASYPERLRKVVEQKPDIVVVSGGRNDLDGNVVPGGVPVVARAAGDLLGDLKQALPQARLVVVAPFVSTAAADPKPLQLRDALKARAEQLGATFVDPLAERWINEQNVGKMIGEDKVHPTGAGHLYLGQRLAEALAA